ncbi:NADPH oxidase activator 1 [Monodelphis domestica]|uniref:NADPH oxidase activator 1 n=1 Tax=Monodelphis domestica TaxID=13616 RepID=UPI0024E1B880|nr:NADPH oxidase activator 1 [Monodelphis domestica]
MSYRDLVKSWHEAVQALDRKDWDMALELFSRIEEPPSKICFNMGCVHLLTGNPEAALKALDQTVVKDPCMAVGFFLRGVVHFQLARFSEALSDYDLALTNLRNNTFIDYKQLGLRYKLQAWEVLYNMAAVQCQLGLWEEATRSLENAISKKLEGSSASLEAALDQVKKRIFLDLLQIPKGEVFCPRKKDVEQLNSMDFLGKSKVISSVNPNDRYIGFEPLRPQESHNGIPCSHTKGPPKRPHLNQVGEPVSPLQGLPPPEGISLDFTVCPERMVKGQRLFQDIIPEHTKYHRSTDLESERDLRCHLVQLPYFTDEYTMLSAGNANRKARPSLLEELIYSQEKSQLQIKRKGPVVLRFISILYSMSHQGPAAQGEVSSSLDTSVRLNVHCTFTVTLEVKRGTSVPVLRALLREKLLQQSECAQLSYSHQDSGKFITISEEEACKKMWQEAAAGRRLSLQCQGTECTGGRPVLYRMVAQYSYSAQGPEDLEFQKGDTLDILSEVNDEWLEGHCRGHIGIFPKCFAQLASIAKEEAPIEAPMTYTF